MCYSKVAIIGGNPSLVHSLEHYLINFGELLHVQQVSDPRIKKCFAALICHDLPLTNGIENLKCFKQYHPDIPAIMIAGKVPRQDIVESFRIGAEDFLLAPHSKEVLQNCLSRFYEPLIDVFDNKVMVEQMMEESIERVRSSELSVKMLGGFSLNLNGKQLVNLPAKRALSVLSYIFYKYPRTVHRDTLIDKFWSDANSSSARNCLNVTLHSIRKSLAKISEGKDILVFNNECYGIDPELEIMRDFDVFESLWKKGRRFEQDNNMEAAVDVYQQAYEYYQGDFMENLHQEEWTEQAKHQLSEIYLVVLDRLSVHFFEKNKYSECMHLCKKMLEKDSCLEGAHRRLMASYLHLDMKDMAIRQFQKCKDGLKEELNIVPGNATVELYQRILAA